MIAPMDTASPPLVPQPQKTSAPPAPTHPNDAWRRAEFAALARQHPDLVRWHAAARTSKWLEVGTLIMGLKSYLPYAGEEYPHLLKLLLLDPPSDDDVATAVPKIAVRRMKTGELIPLWEKLVYPGSPNEKQIRAAADAYLSAKQDSLVPSAKERLQKLARPSR